MANFHQVDKGISLATVPQPVRPLDTCVQIFNALCLAARKAYILLLTLLFLVEQGAIFVRFWQPSRACLEALAIVYPIK